ncbi:Arc-like DNA binding domain-containing protein [Anaerocolumna jejuensis DSM 15929]|uniref:Arc-like DNA binding domain-containing protein n=1 Tax=Anaerocolumna jejuensis DSM 15929 TaxID=1121322 RepID=A0A1M6VPB7_9FIRM|nr:Arc family DNA-binding protein [Anaerocolumna jejuensis]SHK83372.1 Arc-like DNA binding domain-containing protein [Anaerocolumna jejuensis DSM 15929]
MRSDLSKFTLRTDAELLKKFRFVADYNDRSANREIEVLMKKHVDEFEKKHGKITTE